MDNVQPHQDPSDRSDHINPNDDLYDAHPLDDSESSTTSSFDEDHEIVMLDDLFILPTKCGWPQTAWHMATMSVDVVTNAQHLAQLGLATVGWHLPLVSDHDIRALSDMHRIARFLHYILACAAHGLRYRNSGFSGIAPAISLPEGVFIPVTCRVAQDCFMRIIAGVTMDMQLE